MRISDWSSDVCSSDLGTSDRQSLRAGRSAYARLVSHVARRRRTVTHGPPDDGSGTLRSGLLRLDESPGRPSAPARGAARSEARRVGKEGVRTSKSRWTPYH